MLRRRFLATVGSGVVAGLAGCTAPLGPRPKMDLTVANYRPSPVPAEIAFVRPGVDDPQEARVYRERVELPEMDGDADMVRREDVVPARRYDVELSVLETGRTYDYRYKPECSGTDDVEDGVRINVNHEEPVRFTQSSCSGGGLF